jgi:hypothetical protein
MDNRVLGLYHIVPPFDNDLGKIDWPLAVRNDVLVVKMRVGY